MRIQLILASFFLSLLFPGSVDAESPQTAMPLGTSGTAVRPPIKAYIALDTGWSLPLAALRQTVYYRLHIERDTDVKVQSISIAPTALRRALGRSTALPAVLFDVIETGRSSRLLPDYRRLDTVDYALKFSKPGHYHIPALTISYLTPQATIQQFQSLPQQGFMLTIPTHLPPQSRTLPGDLLTPAFPPLRPWWWHPQLPLTLLLCGLLSLSMGLWCRPSKRLRHQRDTSPPLSEVRQQYLSALQHLRHQAPVAPGPISDIERGWMRQAASLIRRLLGDWACGDDTSLTGGAGISATMILAHLQINDARQETLLAPPLRCLESLDRFANAPSRVMALEDYAQILDTIEQTIFRLTEPEATRVRCLPSSL